MSLNISQLSFSLSSLRAVSQEIPWTSPLNSLKFVFLRFRVLTLLFAYPVSLKIENSARACSLQARLPAVLSCPVNSSTLVNNRSGNLSLLVGLPIICTKKLFSTHYCSLLDCLQFGVPLFQQISGWLKSPSRVRACEHDIYCCWRKNSSQHSLLDWVACSRYKPQIFLCWLSLCFSSISSQSVRCCSLCSQFHFLHRAFPIPFLPCLSLLNGL